MRSLRSRDHVRKERPALFSSRGDPYGRGDQVEKATLFSASDARNLPSCTCSLYQPHYLI